MEFPHFSGRDPHEWLYKETHYFQVYEELREDRVAIAYFHLDGKASKWWRWIKALYAKGGKRLMWTAFEHEFMEQ